MAYIALNLQHVLSNVQGQFGKSFFVSKCQQKQRQKHEQAGHVDKLYKKRHIEHMANLATKAPNFTKENAAEMARRATISRKARIQREREELEAEKAAFRLEQIKPTEDARKKRVEFILDSFLDDLNKETDRETKVKLAGALDKLWSLVYAKKASEKSSKQRTKPQIVAPVEPNAVQ